MEVSANNGIGDGVENGATRKDGGRSANACRNGERVEQEQSGDDGTTPALVTAWGGEACGRASLARLCDPSKSIGAQDIDGDVKKVGEDGKRRVAREQVEDGQQEGRLVVDAAIVRRDIMVV